MPGAAPRADAGSEMRDRQIPECLRLFRFEAAANTLQTDMGEVRSLLVPR